VDASGPLALVLTGGGARAAYQVGVLAAVAERLPALRIPILAGASAGAINTIYLAAYRGALRDAVGQLRGQWARLTSDQIYGLHSLRIAGSLARWVRGAVWEAPGGPPPLRGIFDTRPLATFLSGCVDFAGIRENVAAGRLHAAALSATSYATGCTTTFVEGAPGTPLWRRAGRHAVQATLALDHVMASSAIPIAFPAVAVGGEYFGDGSVRQTYPLSPAVHLGARRILAIGTAPSWTLRSPVGPAKGHPSIAEGLGLLLDSVFLDALDADVEGLERVNRLLARWPEGEPAPEGLRPISILLLRPSQDLGPIAASCVNALPRVLRFLVGGLGGLNRGGVDFLSYLMFEPPYTGRLFDLGRQDALAQWGRIEAFLAPM
jgi:NTE family protein